MNVTDKKSELAQYLMTQGIFAPEDQEAKIAELAATYPAAKAAEEGLTDVVDIAYAAYKATQAVAAPTQSVAVQTQPTASVSDADRAFINTKLRGEKPMRQQKTRSTKITKLLLGKPAPSDYIPEGTTGILKVEGFKDIQDKIANGTYILLADDPADVTDGVASTTNYNMLVAAVANPEQHPFPVYIGKMNTRPVGYLIDTLDATGANTANQQMTRAEFEKFLILQTEGYVTASAVGMPGAMLRYIDPKNDPSDPGKVKPGRTVVVDKNKKEAIAGGCYDVVTQVIAGTSKEATGKTELKFKVQVAGKTTAKGDPVIRTIRASLKINIPEFESKVQYADKFEVKKDTTWTETPDQTTSSKIHDAQIKAIADLTKAIGTDNGSMDAWAEDIEKFIKPAAQAPGVAL